MIVPIDYEAPKGRLILPQVQAIRDCLDHDCTVIVVKENDYAGVLRNLKNKPDLVVCDSQVVDKMVAETPADIKCTTFSILFARFKGDLGKLVEGASVINRLKDGDKVQLVGFGSFEVKKRAARVGRNPKTKESIEIPASVVPVFKAGKALKDAVAK